MTKKKYNFIFPLVLVIYSLLLTNQGITMTDTGYNYSNFVNYDSLDNMWKFSTYLATAVGNLFTSLPFGHSMLGLNVYTGLVKALIALIIYYTCVYYFDMKSWVVFFAELMALGYCWCPTALLYNYLTYLFFSLGALFLCVAAKSKNILWYVFAGLCLGINVFVRLPNLAEMSLIFAVWFYCYISKKSWKNTLKITGFCVFGYVIGVGGMLIYISLKYGIKEYLDGIYEMITISNEASSYSLATMIKGDIFSYLENTKWLMLAFLPILIGTILYNAFEKKSKIFLNFFNVCNSFLLLYAYKKMDMFDFTYYNYDSIEKVGILFLMLSGILGLYVMFFIDADYPLKMHAATMGIVILITPLGSNNYLFSAINNLFWITPFVFHCCYKWTSHTFKSYTHPPKFSWEPLRITFTIIVMFTFFQGIIFGTQFVFRDGTNGEKRTEKILNIPALSNMYTQPQIAAALNELNNYLSKNELKNIPTILYNNVPGLAFYLNLEPALSSTWPDLDSFSAIKFQNELQIISNKLTNADKPLIILGKKLDTNIPKQNILQDFMKNHNYQLLYSNEMFYLYR